MKDTNGRKKKSCGGSRGGEDLKRRSEEIQKEHGEWGRKERKEVYPGRDLPIRGIELMQKMIGNEDAFGGP